MDEVSIYNIALSRVGIGQTVRDRAERTEPAAQCRKFFAHCRDECLRNFPWTFARRWKPLAELTEAERFPGWAYAYEYPQDCLFALEIIPEGGLRYPVQWVDLWQERISNRPPRIPFERALRSDGNAQILITDLYQAYLIYIARVTAENVWDAGFVDMLGWRLAAEVGRPLKVNAALAKDAWSNYEAMRGRHTASDFNEGYPDAEPDTPSLIARGY